MTGTRPPVQTPEWVKDATFYQIFPDRFARSGRLPSWVRLEPWDTPPTREGFKGGDLWGVLARLDYLQDLGITAIYFNPIFQSAANHRYHTHDYHQVDPLLGGNEAFRALLDEAHRRGIRIVLDGVFNHASRGFFPFHHILENGPASPYLDWFHIKGYPLHAYSPRRKPNYAAWWGLPALPKFNTDCPGVREFLWDVGERWVREGVDGWRLDVPFEIDDDAFWQEFRRRVKGVNPEAYIVGEVWGDARRWLQGDQFDAVMNYLFSRAVLGFFGGPDLEVGLPYGIYRLRRLTVQAFARQVRRLLALYPWEVSLAQLNLLGSHDTPRLLTLLRGNRARVKLATLFQMCYPGAPCIYYGDEVGLAGGPDPDCRRSMPWDEAQWDRDLRAWFQAAISLRKAHVALRRGEFLPLLAREDVYAFARRAPGETLVALFNLGGGPARVDLRLRPLVADGAVLEDLWQPGTFGKEGVVVQRGHAREVLLPSLSARVFLVREAAGQVTDHIGPEEG